MRPFLPRVLSALLAPALLLGLAMVTAAPTPPPRTALSVPDKPGLYQRVLTRPAARLRAAPGGAVLPGPPLPPLTVLYVFGRQGAQGQDWVEVGAAAAGPAQGWIEAGQAIDWHQTLTLAFTRTSRRDPALFFRDHDRLAGLLEAADLGPGVARLRAALKSAPLPADFPVIAKEPDTYIDPNRQFYLLPILSFESVYLGSGHETMLLKVAAVTLQAGEQGLSAPGAGEAGSAPKPGPQDAARPTPGPAANRPVGYRAGVVFVIDTSISMGPYIERTRAAVRRIYDRLRGSPLGARLSFGLVAFRSNVDAAPGLDYVSRVVATLEDGRDPATFQAKVAGVEEAKVSSKGFDEDAFAGVQDALERIDWTGFDARYIVLITDAGALDAKNPLGRTGLSAARLRLLAQEKDQSGGGKVAIAVLHLLTRAGLQNHDKAARQYRELSRWGDAGDLYFPVAGGAVDAFGAQVDTLGDALLRQLESAAADRPIEVPEGPKADPVARKTALVGRAMQLAYLGRETGSRAPRLIEAWVADRDLLDPSQKTLEVRVMISKNQLSNLQETLQAIFAAGERTQLSTKDFFDQLRGAAAALARDPDQVGPLQVKRLGDLGLVGAWLDGLPYTSQVMNLTQERWVARSYAEQQEVLDVIEEKIALYRKIHDDTDRWISLNPRAPPGESVTTVPLDALP